MLIISVVLNGALMAQQPSAKEYEIKAVFLYNFTQFIEWPVDVFSKADAPLVIGIVGSDPFGNYLDETIQGEVVSGHPLVVRRFRDASEIDVCQILYVGTEDKSQLKQIFERSQVAHILTVGDGAGFIKQGGMIRLFAEQNKMRIRINLGPVKTADLKVSSKLLRLAEIVEP